MRRLDPTHGDEPLLCTDMGRGRRDRSRRERRLQHDVVAIAANLVPDHHGLPRGKSELARRLHESAPGSEGTTGWTVSGPGGGAGDPDQGVRPGELGDRLDEA